MMTMPEDFITELLVKKYRAVHLVAGHDFRFGYKNQGDPEKLRENAVRSAFGCDIIPKVELDGVTVSSDLYPLAHRSGRGGSVPRAFSGIRTA